MISTPLLFTHGSPLRRQSPGAQLSRRRVAVRAIQTRGKDDAEAPPLRDENLELEKGREEVTEALSYEAFEESVVGRAVRGAFRRVLLELSSLPRSMAVMFGISVLSSFGTVIEQGQDFQFYVDNYPAEGKKVLGFLTYKVIYFLQLDHIYSAPYFYALIALLVAQLIACTHTRQWPIAKVAKRWRFVKTPKGIAAKDNAEILPDANIRDLGIILQKKGYEIFLRDDSLYGFKSIVGRFAPIGVHIALLVTIAGIGWGVVGGFKGTAMIPEEREIMIGEFLRPSTAVAAPPSGARKMLRVDDFNISYRSDGSIAQFYSDLSVVDQSGQVLMGKKISVNDPLRFEGITMYQTDWGMSALSVTIESDAFSEEKQKTVLLPMASLESRKDGANRVFATFIPLPGTTQEGSAPRGVSVLANDFQTVILYDSSGQFAGIRRPGSGKSIEVEGMTITVNSIVGSTGLEMKYDPGVPLVYAGFGGLMITTILSLLSHSQVWALQNGRDLHVAGRSNRAEFLFQKELSEMLDQVPDSGLAS